MVGRLESICLTGMTRFAGPGPGSVESWEIQWVVAGLIIHGFVVCAAYTVKPQKMLLSFEKARSQLVGEARERVGVGGGVMILSGEDKPGTRCGKCLLCPTCATTGVERVLPLVGVMQLQEVGCGFRPDVPLLTAWLSPVHNLHPGLRTD